MDCFWGEDWTEDNLDSLFYYFLDIVLVLCVLNKVEKVFNT